MRARRLWLPRPFRYATEMDRIGRKSFWICVALCAALYALLRVFSPYYGVGGIAAAVVLILRPRLHDIGRSGWWSIIPFGIAIAMLALLGTNLLSDALALQLFIAAGVVLALAIVIAGAIPGQPGRNRYGGPAGRTF
ncbi:MAG: DUF805 domain-containing protein [Sphingomonadales bacterium]|nr:MAG: DUF805 domain-containing protein [Sphingomonadales bacterium]